MKYNIQRYADLLKLVLRKRFEGYTKEHGHKARLVIFQFGDDPASNSYIKGKMLDGQELGVEVILKKYTDIPANDERFAERTVKEWYKKNFLSCEGLIVQFPLPKGQKFNKDIINQDVDVDGFSSNALTYPCTAHSVLMYLNNNEINLVGKNAVVIGRSDLVGKPLAGLLLNENANVTILHSKTKEKELRDYCENADFIFVAVGKPNLINKSFKLKKSAMVFDIGINRLSNGLLVGDCEPGLDVAFQTPVPGGVGLLTRIGVFTNLLYLIDIQYIVDEIVTEQPSEA